MSVIRPNVPSQERCKSACSIVGAVATARAELAVEFMVFGKLVKLWITVLGRKDCSKLLAELTAIVDGSALNRYRFHS
jgi:hypothetical protein